MTRGASSMAQGETCVNWWNVRATRPSTRRRARPDRHASTTRRTVAVDTLHVNGEAHSRARTSPTWAGPQDRLRGAPAVTRRPSPADPLIGGVDARAAVSSSAWAQVWRQKRRPELAPHAGCRSTPHSPEDVARSTVPVSNMPGVRGPPFTARRAIRLVAARQPTRRQIW